MLVVHINHSDFGGAAIAAARLHKGMLASGVNSKFLTFIKTQNDIPEHYVINQMTCSKFPAFEKIKLFSKRILKKTGIISDFEKKHVRNRPAGFELFTFPFSDFDISHHPLVKAADIIHLHWVARGLLDYQKFFQIPDKRVVWTLHDMNPFTGGCHHSDDSIGYQSDCFPCPQLKNTIDESLAKKVLAMKITAVQLFPKNNMIIVTPSKWLLNTASQSKVFAGFGKQNIPNGVDPQIFRSTDKIKAREILNLPLNAKILLFASLEISNPRKGMHQLIDAIKNIQKDKNIILCALGHSKLIDLPGLVSLGYIRDEKKLALAYAAADLFVLPSLAENFPNVICESLMCGTPVVAYHVGGIPEQVNELNSILVPPGDVIKLTQAIEKILSETVTYNTQEISNAAINQFSVDKAVQEYKVIYSKLILN